MIRDAQPERDRPSSDIRHPIFSPRLCPSTLKQLPNFCASILTSSKLSDVADAWYALPILLGRRILVAHLVAKIVVFTAETLTLLFKSFNITVFLS